MLKKLHDKLTKPASNGEYSFGLLTEMEYGNLLKYTRLLLKLFELPERVQPVLMICLVDVINSLCVKAYYKKLIAKALGRDIEYVKDAFKQLVKCGLLISLNCKDNNRCAVYRFIPGIYTFGCYNSGALSHVKSFHIICDPYTDSIKMEIELPIYREESSFNANWACDTPVKCDVIEI